MHIPHYYKNENLEEIKDFLVENSFGLLINQVDGKPWATHIPLELDKDEHGKEILVGHIAKVNPQAKSFGNTENVLCVFNGPHAYISSSWYQEEEVPTWNYIAVHIYGSLKVLSDDATMESLHKLVNKYEKNSKNPINLSEMSPKTLRQVKGVIGFKIEITEIQAAYKLSQNRKQDYPKITSELMEQEDIGSKAIARKMNDIKL